MKKVTGFLSVIVLTLLLFSASVFAAKDYRPGTVGTLKVTSAKETTVGLKWSTAKNAQGYYVYMSTGNNQWKKVGTTSKKSCMIKNLNANKTYWFKVIAYRKVKKTTYISPAYSKTVTAKTKLYTPGKPKKLSISNKVAGGLRVSWAKATYATGYEVHQYDAATKKYKLVGRTPGRDFEINNLEDGERYTYAVRSYRSKGGAVSYSAFSSRVTGKPITLSKAASAIHGIQFSARTNKRTEVFNYSTGKSQILKAGTSVISTEEAGAYVTAYLTNGQKIRIKGSAINVSGYKYSKGDWSKAAKEEYVNKRGWSSRTNYLVWVSQYTCRVNIFKGSRGNWQLVRSFKCIIGKYSTRTPRGTFRVRSSKKNSSYGGPIVYFTQGGNSFHSLLGATPGKPYSNGCIRCPSADLKYLYKYCKVNTAVYSM